MSADDSLMGKGKSKAWGGEAGFTLRIPSADTGTTTMSFPFLLNALEPKRTDIHNAWFCKRIRSTKAGLVRGAADMVAVEHVALKDLAGQMEQLQRSLGAEARDEADAVGVDCFKQAFRELRGTIDPELNLDF